MYYLSHRRFALEATQELILVRVLINLGIAAFGTTASLYFKELGMSPSAIGIITSLALVVNLVFALILPKLLETHRLATLLFGGVAGFALSLLLFGQFQTTGMAIALFIGTLFTLSLFSSSYSILFHDDSASNRDFLRNQALLGSLGNLSWFIGPFLAALIVDQFSFRFLYTSCSLLVFGAAAMLLIQRIPEHSKKRLVIDKNVFSNIRYYLSQKHLRDSYAIGMGVDMWWTFVFVFITLFMKEVGFTTSQIGLFVATTQLPLLLLEFNMYRVVEKFQYRRPLVMTFGLLTGLLLIAAFVGISYFSLLLLIIGSLGLAFAEPCREMYLYSKMKPLEEERAQPIFATSGIIGSIVVRLLCGLILLALPYSATFLIMATLMGATTSVMVRTKD